MAAFDYTAAGHITIDVLADGSSRPGGGAFYSALQASRLGLRTLIITRGRAREIERLLEPYSAELELSVQPAAHTTTLQSRDGDSEQRVLAWAGPIEEPPTVDTDILHFAPVARETGRQWRGNARFIGLTPQGLVRAWDATGERMRLCELSGEQLPERLDAVVISEHERGRCGVLFAERSADRADVAGDSANADGLPVGTRGAPLVAVTDAHRATVLYLAAAESLALEVPRVAQVVDDTGAGDVFAAAFFYALASDSTPRAAITFASAAAAVRLGGKGPNGVGTRDAIEHRMHGAAHAR